MAMRLLVWALIALFILLNGQSLSIFEPFYDTVNLQPNQPSSNRPLVHVQESDFIYRGVPLSKQAAANSSPVVLEKYKLLFFTVQKTGCTVWKKLFRRMMGYEDWKTKPAWNIQKNGLRYLRDYSLSEAEQMMNDPSWTRAMFVRNPKERFLSAYLDKRGKYIHNNCCRSTKFSSPDDCTRMQETFMGFVFNLTHICKDTHWAPQSERIDAKFLPLLNFVGHLETAEGDAKLLLQRIGAWDEFGKTGWGQFGNESIFASNTGVEAKHRTSNGTKSSAVRLAQYYTPEIEQEVDERFAKDYEIPQYGLKKTKIDFSAVG
jgi:hypothetical protein